jgi:hypothetical protein
VTIGFWNWNNNKVEICCTVPQQEEWLVKKYKFWGRLTASTVVMMTFWNIHSQNKDFFISNNVELIVDVKNITLYLRKKCTLKGMSFCDFFPCWK